MEGKTEEEVKTELRKEKKNEEGEGAGGGGEPNNLEMVDEGRRYCCSCGGRLRNFTVKLGLYSAA